MHNDVVEHIFMYGEIVCGNDERDTHYYITRGRVKAKKENLFKIRSIPPFSDYRMQNGNVRE